jgi:hypothetical protein
VQVLLVLPSPQRLPLCCCRVLLLLLILSLHLCAGSYLMNLVWILAGWLPMHTAWPCGRCRPRLAATVAGLLLLLLLLLLQVLPW